jgi:DNA-binding HxlR family transcriptional regulator
MKPCVRTSHCGCAAGRACLCPSVPLFRPVGSRHTVPLVSLLANRGVMRFHELQRRMTSVSSSTLAARVAALEQESLITRAVRPDTPPAVEYSLAARGRGLASVLKLLVAIRQRSANR